MKTTLNSVAPEGQRKQGEAGASRIVVVLGLVALYSLVGLFMLRSVLQATVPADFSNIVEQWKYGSIGSDTKGLPYRLWKVLPEVFADKLPGQGLQSIGVIWEAGQDTPVGVSLRKGRIPLIGLNCAVCHTGTVRESDDKPPLIIPAMPSHQFNLGDYFNFLFACVADPRFNSATLMPAMERDGKFGLLEKFAYPTAIKKTKEALLTMSQALSYLNTRPPMGPGRVDTFNPYKTLFFHKDMSKDKSIGTVDFPAVWEQEAKRELWMHWDGNNNSIDERNISASLGAGATYDTLDTTRLGRLRDWLMLMPARPYPFGINKTRLAAGEKVYAQHCASCHTPGGALFGQVTKVEELGTDRHRVDAFDDEMVADMNTIGKGYPWQFSHFRKTGGYVNRPLDGIWARAPYLHNGSVPTLDDLLQPVSQRPTNFYRGYDVFDQKKVGFVSDKPEQGGRKFFKYDTALPGNANTGHVYGSDLSEGDKIDLIEYMKTL